MPLLKSLWSPLAIAGLAARDLQLEKVRTAHGPSNGIAEDILSALKMAEHDASAEKLAELLRHPEDLDKISNLKADLARKKAGVDEQLKSGLKEQLEVTQSGMGAIADSQRAVAHIKEEMMKIDKLCAESQNMTREFPNINVVSQIHRNFSQVGVMKDNLEDFNRKVDELEILLEKDEADLENQPNLLDVHAGLTNLREIRDEAIDQLKQVNDESLERELQDWFTRLDDVVAFFDEHFGVACGNLIPLVQTDNRSMIVRLALVIGVEEKSDMKVKAMQEAQKEHKELASRFKSIKSGPKQLRGYKEKFIGCIEADVKAKLEQTEPLFMEESDKLGAHTNWFFSDLKAVKEGMGELMPRKWKIYRTYTDIYHRHMHDWLISLIDDKDKCSSAQILSIVDYRAKYYKYMKKLAWRPEDLQPDLLDDREVELIREWRQLIVKSVDEWMGRMFAVDRTSFLSASVDNLDKDANGYFRTKTLSDMWRMLREQLQVAGDSGRQDVVEGVVDEMCRALKRRLANWTQLITDEAERYSKSGTDPDGVMNLQDWLVALANDQIACVDDNPDVEQWGYLSRFQQEFGKLVGPEYRARADQEIEAIRDSYFELATHCVQSFVALIFAIDFKPVMPEFFTTKWYSEFGLKRMVSTFEDYYSDYEPALHNSLVDVFVEQLADSLLIAYLSCVRNKGAKFRRQDPFTDKVGDDVRAAFVFFEKFPGVDFGLVKGRWKATHHMVRLLEADKAGVPDAYEACKRDFWDVQLSWVEAVLRGRDDYERAMLSGVKSRAAQVSVERPDETTIMGKIK
ncbi:MAG: SNARE-binding exocyst subunit S6 [Stictis urceolatum]|nr:SNARE-binding exocyst subunit S6 [Stictis urceolata]